MAQKLGQINRQIGTIVALCSMSRQAKDALESIYASISKEIIVIQQPRITKEK